MRRFHTLFGVVKIVSHFGTMKSVARRVSPNILNNYHQQSSWRDLYPPTNLHLHLRTFPSPSAAGWSNPWVAALCRAGAAPAPRLRSRESRCLSKSTRTCEVGEKMCANKKCTEQKYEKNGWPSSNSSTSSSSVGSMFSHVGDTKTLLRPVRAPKVCRIWDTASTF